MHLSRLIVKNYRSIRYTDIKFCKGKNIIVGKNNAGKSNIIKALNLVLGEKYPTYVNINENDFFCGLDESASNFYIVAELSGDDIDKENIINSKGFYVGEIFVKPLYQDTMTGEIEVNHEHIFFEPDEYYHSSVRHLRSYKKHVHEKENWLREIDGQKVYFIFFVEKKIYEEDGYFKDIRMFYKNKINKRWYVSWGISKQIRDSFLTSAIVDSFRDTSNQLRINNYSWYGKLIKRIWDIEKYKYDDNGYTIEEVILSKFRDVKDIASSIFDDVASSIQKTINTSFDDTTILFQMNADNRADIHKNTTIYINDGFESHISDKGSGIQSAVIINLFTYFCHVFHKNTSLLVIEEPELYLHPQARRTLSVKLEEFIDIVDGKENQIILTTHSTEFISAGNNLNGIVLVKKENNQTNAFNYSFEEIDTKELQTLLKNENSEMFFADKVILVEGAEKYLIPIIADDLCQENNVLDSRNISVIRVSGKGDFYKYYRILKKCNIPAYIVADRDYFFYGIKNIFDDIDDINDEEKRDILNFAHSVNSRSVTGYKSKRQVEERTIKAEQSLDAKALCDALERLSERRDSIAVEELVRIWEYIKPSVQRKDIDQYMGMNGLSVEFNRFRDLLWENNIYILSRGELESYFTKDGLAVEGTKEEKVINMVRNISPDSGIGLSCFIDTTEYKDFLAKVLNLEEE